MKEDSPMKCDRCRTSDAVMHVTQVVQNESKLLNLCDDCARDMGFAGPAVPANFPLGDFLAQLGGDTPGGSERPDGACAFCGLTFAEFRESGRLGCPHCYSAFEGHLRGLLRRIHGGTQHTGKVYLPPDPTQTEKEKRLDGLRRRLERAVDAEDFERAAHLRDQIRSLELSGREGNP